MTYSSRSRRSASGTRHLVWVTVSVTFVLLTAGPVHAQDASGYFHQGAQAYVDQEMSEARTAVERGLHVAPDDPKLLALKEKLEQEQQQQNQQKDQQGQDQDEQDQQDEQQDGQQDQQDEQRQDQGAQDGEQNDQDESQQQPEPEEQEGSQQDRQEGEQQEGETQQVNPEDLNKLSREQALRILQAMEQDEEQLLREILKPKTNPRRVEKDW